MILKQLRGIIENKIKTFLVIIGVAICFLAITSVDGMLEYMITNRNNEVERFKDKVLVLPYGSDYPPFRNIIPIESVKSILSMSDINQNQSTPLIFLVISPPDNPMDIAGITGIALKPGCENVWVGSTQAISGKTTLVGENDNAVILGFEAAEFFNVNTAGEEIVIAGHKWNVAGILKRSKNANLIDTDNLVLMTLAQAQSAFNMEGHISSLLLTPNKGYENTLQHSLSILLPSLEVFTWDHLHTVLKGQLDMPKKFLSLISMAAFLIVMMIITNSIILWVQEENHKIDIERKALQIIKQIFFKALLISMLGGFIGLVAAMPLAYFLGWAWILTWKEIIRIMVMIMFSGILASIYPYYYVVKTHSQALKYSALKRKVEEIDSEKRAIDEAYRNLINAREEERARLSHELHDQAIQSLIGLKFLVAEKVSTDHSDLQSEINAIIESLRIMCTELRPPALDSLGLVAVLESFIKNYSMRRGLAADLIVDGAIKRMSPEVELVLFRVVQEALNNIWKHAASSCAKVSLIFGEEGILVEISDKGLGFSVPERLGKFVEEGHFGLMNIYERVESIGGTLSIKSTIGKGTEISISVPKNCL